MSASKGTLRVVKAAAAYWSLVFALGFALGAVRVTWGAEALGGETNFLLLEVPVMVLASWSVARRTVVRFGIAARKSESLSVGGLAFALLMASELALATTVGEGGAAAWLASLTAPPGLYGFLGQLAFALMPWLVAARSNRVCSSKDA